MKRNAIIALIIAALITYPMLLNTVVQRIAGCAAIWFPIFVLLVGTEKAAK